MLIFIAIGALTTLLVSILTPLSIRLGHHLNIVDHPGGRRQHSGVIPRIGGLAIFASFFIVLLLIQILPNILHPDLASLFPTSDDPNETRRFIALLIGAAFCVMAGFLDDRYDWPAFPQYIVQFIASLIAIAGIIIDSDFHILDLSSICPHFYCKEVFIWI